MTIRLYGKLDKCIPLDPNISLTSVEEALVADQLNSVSAHGAFTGFFQTYMPALYGHTYQWGSAGTSSGNFPAATSGTSVSATKKSSKPAVPAAAATAAKTIGINAQRILSPIENNVYHVSVGEFLDANSYGFTSPGLSSVVATNAGHKVLNSAVITMKARHYKKDFVPHLKEKLMKEVSDAIFKYNENELKKREEYYKLITQQTVVPLSAGASSIKLNQNTASTTINNNNITFSGTSTVTANNIANNIKMSISKNDIKKEASKKYVDAQTKLNYNNNVNGPYKQSSAQIDVGMGINDVTNAIKEIYAKPEYKAADAYMVVADMQYVKGFEKPEGGMFYQDQHATGDMFFKKFRVLPRGLQICYLDLLDQKDAMDQALSGNSIG